MTIVPVITVDGPSGVGKGTLSKALADKFKWNLLDSGAIYRLLALAALNHQVALNDEDKLVDLASHLDVRFIAQSDQIEIWLEGDNVTDAIRNETVGNTASQIAALSPVRKALLERQRAFRQSPGLIADGRDMGTIVFPQAQVKLFLDASAEERAKRRMRQLQEKGISVKFDRLLSEIQERDDRDRNRSVAPLRPADDALVLDSTHMTINEVIEKSLAYISSVLKQKV